MNVAVPETQRHQQQAFTFVDSDVHPTLRNGLKDLVPFLSPRWHEHLDLYGPGLRQGLSKALPFPRMAKGISRGDSWPPEGGLPGSSLSFMQKQHLDANGVEFGLLQTLTFASSERNFDFGAALAHAINDWQRDTWLANDPRLKGAIVITQENPEAAVAEIKERARDRRFVQIDFAPRSLQPAGARCYWPIYEAAVEHNLVVGMHVQGRNGYPQTGGGFPSFYFENYHSNVQSVQSVVASLAFQGVFERFPKLKFVLIECGIGWIPAQYWRLDKHWDRMRSEVPQCKRPPSEYLREHVWYTTQPIEEPERPSDLLHLLDWIGWDRLLFSTDYPHWDFDDPKQAFKVRLTEEQKNNLFRDNARRVYGLAA